MEDTAIKNEATIYNGLDAFAKRWGLYPNGILMNERTFNEMHEDFRRIQKFYHVPIYRSPDVKDNEIRFII